MMNLKQPAGHRSRLFMIGAVIVAYWIIAMSMVFINKQLISGHDPTVDISVFIVWMQTLEGVTFVMILHVMSNYLRCNWDLPSFSLQSIIYPDMIAASMFFTGTLIFNNLMLKHISVAFYQLARSLTLIFVILFSLIVLQEKVSWKIATSCLLIIFGFYIGVDEEMFSQGLKIHGVIYGVAASLSAALCGVFYKRVQIWENPSSLQMTFNTQIISFVALCPLMFYTSQLSDFLQSPMSAEPSVLFMLVLSGITSVLMGWISAHLIRLTSPLTHNISITTKSVLQTILAVLWSGESRSYSWWLGNAFVIGGIGVYIANKLSVSNLNTSNMAARTFLLEKNSSALPVQIDVDKESSHVNGKV